jgi:hypothetical protein
MSNWLDAIPSQLFAYILQIPTLVALFIFAAGIRKNQYGQWGKEFIMVLFGSWLFLWWLALTLLQIALNMPRADPFHPGEYYYGFPSSVGYYVAVGVTFIFEFTYLWNIRFSRMYWLGVYLFAIVPGITLCWFQFNSWQEVLLSMGLGTLVTSIFMLFYYHILWPQVPILLNTVPFNYMSCVDTWTLSDEGKAEAERIREAVKASDEGGNFRFFNNKLV